MKPAYAFLGSISVQANTGRAYPKLDRLITPSPRAQGD